MLHRTKQNAADRGSVPVFAVFSESCFQRPCARASQRTATLLSGCMILLSAALCFPAAAQTASSGAANTPPDDIRPDELLQDRFDRRITIPGTQIGAVSFQTAAVADLGFNDNVFAQQSGVKSDFFTDYGARVLGDYGYEGFRADLSLNYLERRYFTLSNEDFWQGGARPQLLIDKRGKLPCKTNSSHWSLGRIRESV